MKNKVKILFFVLMILGGIILQSQDMQAAQPPVILYTDIIAGPNTGGENNNGAYLSIFGKNFGNNINDVKVTIGGGEVIRYMYLGDGLGRPDIQQLSVQLGPNVNTGSVTVSVNGVNSNTDQNFTVRAGDIYFISHSGVDGVETDGGFNDPFRTPNYALGDANIDAGDFIVIRGDSDYVMSSGFENGRGAKSWMYLGRGDDHDGLHPISNVLSGTSETNAITIYGYPGEDVSIDYTSQTSHCDVISNWNYANGFSVSFYAIANIHIDLADTACYSTVLGWYSDSNSTTYNMRLVNIKVEGGGVPVPPSIGGVNINSMSRVENMKLYGMSIGNQSELVPSGMYSHMIYIGHFYTNADLGWLYLHDNIEGRGAIKFDGDQWSSPYTHATETPDLTGADWGLNTNVKMHDSLFQHLPHNAIGIGIGSREIFVYNNVFNSMNENPIWEDWPAISIAGDYGDYNYPLFEADGGGVFYLYNNTLYTSSRINILQFAYGVGGYPQYPDAVYLYNNIIYAKTPTTPYYDVTLDGSFAANYFEVEDKIFSDNNIWYGSSVSSDSNTDPNPPDFVGSNEMFTNPGFIDLNSDNFMLDSGSPAINAGQNNLPLGHPVSELLRRDYNGELRGDIYDIGAFEYVSIEETCFDNIQNQDEIGIDCGGVCSACIIPVTYGLSNFISLITNWLGIGNTGSDVNNDGIVNTRDLGVIMSGWGE